MQTLESLYPDPQVVLDMSTEELAEVLLRLASERTPHHLGSFRDDLVFGPMSAGNSALGQPSSYSPNKFQEVELAVGEAMGWLFARGLVVPAPEPNGRNGWKKISRQGMALLEGKSFQQFRRAEEFPKSLLHTSIADNAMRAIGRGDYAGAVLDSFRTVEEAVRKVGGFGNDDIGVTLMREAFHPKNGVLSDPSETGGEREMLQQLFAGALGYCKNPHSHRTVRFDDPKEAQELLVLASYLLRIVDRRAKMRGV